MTGQFQIDPSEFHPSVHPGDDFYLFANWGWLKDNPLPTEKSRYGILHKLEHLTYERIHSILQEAETKADLKDSPNEIVEMGHFYRLGMDIKKRNREASGPIQEHLDRINRLKTKKEAWAEVGYMHSYGVHPWFKFYSTQAYYLSNNYVGEIYQGGVGFQDKRYYFNRDKVSQKLRSSYHQYISGLFLLLGHSNDDAGKFATDIIDLETQIAKISMFSLEIYPAGKQNHLMDQRELDHLTPHLDWNLFFKGIGIERPDELIVEQPGFINQLDQLIEKTDLKAIKHYLTWFWLNSCAPYLSENFTELHFGFFGRTLSGQKKMKPGWETVVHASNLCLGIHLGKEYVQRHFSPEAREQAREIFESVRQTMRKNLLQITWMSEFSKAKAIEKLDQINLKIGFPDKWSAFPQTNLTAESYIETILNWIHHNCRIQFNRIGAHVEQDEWLVMPQMVNAYYNPMNNEIGLPAGILHPPIFCLDCDPAINYGALGVIIGHELIHVFDAHGQLYDSRESLESWWTRDEEEEYKYRVEPLLVQINKGEQMGSEVENGHLNLGENIADLGGIRLALETLQNLPKDRQPPKILGYSSTQRFFLAYARIWVQQMTEEETIRRTNEDVHSVGENRVNGPLAHMDEFYKAFKVKPHHQLYLTPETRAKIW